MRQAVDVPNDYGDLLQPMAVAAPHTHHPDAEGYAHLADLVDGRDAWWLYETFGWQRLTVIYPMMMLRRAD